MNRELCIYVDVDDTLVRHVGNTSIPIPAVIRHVTELHAKGAIIYCWSAGGAEYARQTAERFGLAHCFAMFLPKPQVIIDDQCVADWPEFVHVYPSACRTFDQYVASLRSLPGDLTSLGIGSSQSSNKKAGK
jgi:hypothetical protein